jgi:hypothetical protein
MIAIKNHRPTKVIHGANDGEFAIAGASIGSVRASLVDAFNIPIQALAFVAGIRVDSGYRIRGGEVVEFCRRWGQKGALELAGDAGGRASESILSLVAEVQQHERRLAALERLLSSEPEDADVLPLPNTMAVRSTPYLDSAQAAAYLGISVSSLYGLVERRHLKPLRGPKRTYRFTTGMLDDYLGRATKR